MALITCRECGKSVSDQAKRCPHCGVDDPEEGLGEMIRKGFDSFLDRHPRLRLTLAVLFFAPIIGGGIWLYVTVKNAPEQIAEAQPAQVDPIEALKAASISTLDTKLLCEMYTLGSDYTDLQREEMEKQIVGHVVEWKLKVYEVDRTSDQGVYRIQTQSCVSGMGALGKLLYGMPSTTIQLHVGSEEERQRVYSLKTDDTITVKGRIVGVTALRNIEIEPAIFSPALQLSSSPELTDEVSQRANMVIAYLRDIAAYSGAMDCVAIIEDGTDDRYITFAARKRHEPPSCPGDPESFPLLDRFRVDKQTGRLEWDSWDEGAWVDIDKFRISQSK